MLLKYALLSLSIVALSACTLHKITDKNELCSQAKRQQAFNTMNPNTAENFASRQGATLDQQAQNNC